jgi:formylglycine-generating enzyme required for sulfatase activity
MAFCRWLAEKTGEPFTLPTEAEWEYACRAGTSSPFSYGGVDEDFSPYANLADVKLRSFFADPYKQSELPSKITKYDDWIPRDTRFDDGGLVTVAVGSYRPNVWQLHDMHGNVAEWTQSTYRPYPYDASDGRENDTPLGEKVVRGGSWRDRPKHCRSASRRHYPSWQGVYNVGFRVVCPAQGGDSNDSARAAM